VGVGDENGAGDLAIRHGSGSGVLTVNINLATKKRENRNKKLPY
jgi:hypothetical protein